MNIYWKFFTLSLMENKFNSLFEVLLYFINDQLRNKIEESKEND